MADIKKSQFTRHAPPPRRVPVYQRVDPKRFSFVGRTNYESGLESRKFIFGMKRKDRVKHMTIIGKAGLGKSRLMEALARQDIAYNKGICFFDPVGDVVRDLAEFVPHERYRDVYKIDLFSGGDAALFNPLKGVVVDHRYHVAHGFGEAMRRIFDSAWSTVLEHTFQFVVLALLDYPKATMKGLTLMLTDEEYRGDVLAHVTNDEVRQFWLRDFGDISRDTLMPLVHKLRQFAANPHLARFMNHGEQGIDFCHAVRDRKIILANVSREKLGKDGATFLGTILLTKLREAMHAQSSDDIFYTYIDDVSLFITESFDQFFVDAQKHNMALTISCQYMDQIPRTLWHTIFGGVGGLLVFRPSSEDAGRLERELAPTFQSKDILQLSNREFYIRMAIGDEVYDPFSAETLEVSTPTE